MNALTMIHIAGGTIALLAGALALIYRKGGASHRNAGIAFAASMLVMAVPATGMSLAIGKPFDSLSGVLTIYFVLTGVFTYRFEAYRPGLLMGLGAFCMLGYLGVEIYGSLTGVRETDAPPGAGYVFATLLALALIGDARRLRQAYPYRRAKVRHVWRMSVAFLMATVNIFGVRPHLFPTWLQESGLLILLAFGPLLVMAWWMFVLRPRSA